MSLRNYLYQLFIYIIRKKKKKKKKMDNFYMNNCSYFLRNSRYQAIMSFFFILDCSAVHCSRDSRFWYYVFFVLDCSALCRVCVCVCVCVCVHMRTIVYKHVINCTTHSCRGKLYSSGVLQGQRIRRSSVNSIGQSTDYVIYVRPLKFHVSVFSPRQGERSPKCIVYIYT